MALPTVPAQFLSDCFYGRRSRRLEVMVLLEKETL
ncbi:hypothetical protein STSP2_02366 [Anaerohalosphaera lusitana]|uniref:Uncharacterized protein n=1 Tax=Anaerohalosphaera lusitana TaxID=1936003 RepID=A0A1U9NMP9_9BACT|nr:hypothetical protein STSP2_02366 [Anaerohalosphaera lusitana]